MMRMRGEKGKNTGRMIIFCVFFLVFLSVRCQTKVHNCKCSYLLLYFIVLLSKILLLIEFCFIVSRIF